MTIRVAIGNGPAVIARLADLLSRVLGLESSATTLASGVSANATAIANEATRAQTAEGTKAAAAELVTLAGRVTTSETAIGTKAAQGDLVSVTARVAAVETGKATATDLTAAVTRIGAVEVALPGKASGASVSALTDRVTTVEAQAGTLTTGLAAEITRATGVEGGHATRLTSIEGAVGTKAAGSDLTNLTTRVTTAESNIATKASASDLAGLTTRVGAVEGEVDTLPTNTDVFNAIVNATAPLVTAAIQRQGRPGDVALRFVTTGSGSGAVAVAADAGAVWRVGGPTITTLRERVALDPARLYRVRWAAKRATDPSDPSGATVRFGIAFFGADGNSIGAPFTQDTTLHVADGRLAGQVTIAVAAGDDLTAWPVLARYASPFVQTFDVDGTTDVQWIDWADITDNFAALTGAVQGAIDAAVAAETERATDSEAVIGGATAANAAAITTEVADRSRIAVAAAPARGAMPLALDPAGAAPLRQDVRTGAVRFAGDPQSEERLSRGGWASGLLDRHDAIGGGLHVNGEHYALGYGAPLAMPRAFTDGATTRAQVALADGVALRRLSIFESEVVAAKPVAPHLVRAACADGSIRYAAARGVGNVANDGILRVIIVHGQSVAVGGTQGPNAAAYLTDPLVDMAGKLRMFSQGIVPAGPTAATLLAPGDYGALVPAYEQVVPGLSGSFGETGWLNLAWMLDGPGGRGYGSNYLVASFGKGNTAYAGLKKGTQPYSNFQNALTALPALAQAAGFSNVVVEAIVWDQGENDTAALSGTPASEATYQGYLTQIRTDMTSDIVATLGNQVPPKLYVLQKAIFESGDLSGVSKAQLSTTAIDPLVVCCGPQYIARFADFYHPLSIEHRILAAYRGKFIRRLVHNQQPYAPLRLASWSKVGPREAVLRFTGNRGKVVIDTSLVTDPGDFGLSYEDSTGIASDPGALRVMHGDKDDELVVEFNFGPSGTSQYLRAGWSNGTNTSQGRTIGPRTCIRDNDWSDVCPATGRVLHNYLCHERIARS